MSRIIVPNWSELQHYKDRDPKWIKNYTRLLSKDEYVQLSLQERGLLHGIWLAYASAVGSRVEHERSVLGASVARLRLAVGSSAVRQRHIDALNHAGFIDIVASDALADPYQVVSPDKRREEKTTLDVTPAESGLDFHGYMDELAQRRKTG